MGSLKDRMYDDMEERTDRKLAQYLTITYDELLQLGHEFHDNVGNDDMVYNHYLTFSDQAPNSILQKIPGIDLQNRMVDIPLHWDQEEQDEEL